MLKIKVTQDYIVLYVRCFNDEEVTFICDYILDRYGVRFKVYDTRIVIETKLYETIFNLSTRYELVLI